jgi:hypothetical protein
MPRLSNITLRIGSDAAKADVEIDGIVHRDLILQRRSVTWPASCKLPRSQRKRLEPQIRRAYKQWLDLAGDGT